MHALLPRILLVLVIFFVSGAGPVSAQKSSDSGSDVREYIKKQWPQFFGAKQTKKPPITLSVTPADKTSKMKQIIHTIETEYEKKLLHYDTLLTKVKMRRDKLAAEGKDTSGVDVSLTKANNTHSRLKDDLAQKKQVFKVEQTDTPASVKRKLGPQLSALKLSFKELHGSVDDVVRELKKASGFTITLRPTKPLLPVITRPVKPTIVVPPPRQKEVD